MKKTIIFCLCLMLIPGAAIAADFGAYVSPKFIYGYTVMDTMKGSFNHADSNFSTTRKSDDHDNVFGGALAFGYNFDTKFNIPVRAELEFSYFSEAEGEFSKSTPAANYKVTQNMNIGTIFANAYYDFNTGTKFTPYVGGGIGMAFIESDGKLRMNGSGHESSISVGEKNTTNFAFNAGLGCSYNLTNNWDLDLGYRFAWLGDAKTKSKTRADNTGQLVSVQAKSEDIYMHQVALGIRYTF